MAMSQPQPSPDSDPSQAPDRRQWQRAQAEWPITVVLDDGPHEARIRDVSRGGVCFFLDRPVPEMTALRIEFDLPVAEGVRRISGLGAVVRCEKISQALDHYEIAVFLRRWRTRTGRRSRPTSTAGRPDSVAW